MPRAAAAASWTAPDEPGAALEQALHQTRLEDGPAARITISASGQVLECDPAAARMLRVPAGSDLRDFDIRQFFRHPDQLAETLRAVQVTGMIENWDGDLVTFDGSSLRAVVNLVGDFNECRVLTAVHATLFNITEWSRVHERKLLAQRFETVGRLAGGIAHDFNNLLTVISGHAECLAAATDTDGSARRSLTAIRESAARGAALTQRLLAFGRRQVLLPRTVDPRELVLTVEGDLRRTFGRRIAVGVDLDPAVHSVRVDPEQLERALGTIAAHAIDAMPNGGAITFRMRNLAVDAGWPQTRSFAVAQGDYVAIETACAGMTLDRDTAQRIFEPFHNRRGGGRDALGLAAVFGLVKQSGGYIWVEAEAAQTMFTILLAAEPAAEPVPRRVAGAPTTTVLVVDDDDDVRGLLVSVLKHQGYAVLNASSAEQGSRLSETNGIDILVADVGLGGVRGDEFAAALLGTYPDMKLVCISGDAEPGTLRTLDPQRAVFLEKPFSARQLTERVDALLRH